MEGTPVPEDWTARLASAIAAAVREYQPLQQPDGPVAAFHVGCFPWHGSIELSALTADELSADPALLGPGEVAAWHHYAFAAGLASWAPVAELGRQMSDAYGASAEADRSETVEAFLRACAASIASPEVTATLGFLERDPMFRISVAHPDDDREFYPPVNNASA